MIIKSKGTSAIPVIAIIFAILALYVAGYFFYTTTKVINENVSATTNATNGANTTNNANVANANMNFNTGETKDWLTYEDKDNGFTVKYPTNWKVSTCDETDDVWFSSDAVPCETEWGGEGFVVLPEPEDFDLQETLDLMKDDDSNENLTESTISVAGVTAKRLSGTTRVDAEAMFGGGFVIDQVYVPYGGGYILLSYIGKNAGAKFYSEFSSFFSTLTFTK